MAESRPPDAATGLGGYEIVRRIAVGGMAEVLLARHTVRPGIERLVVIKSILPGLSLQPDLVSMFLSEARVAAQLQHANVVHIHDVTRLGTRPCIVMEHLHGLDTRRLCQRFREKGEALPIGVIAAIGEGAAHGLGYAHRATDADGKQLSVVHRDVSPHNLFVTTDGVVKVLDFGIAKSTAQLQQTQAGTLKGKIAYMSPEQLRGEVLDGRSDLFALGSVLWELATGRALFARGTEVETFAAAMEGPIDPPSTLRAGIPEAFDRALMWALSRDRAGRPSTGEEFARALHAIAESECDGPPVLATAKLVQEILALEASSAPPLASSSPTKAGVAGTPPRDDGVTDMARAMTLSLVSAGSGGAAAGGSAPEVVVAPEHMGVASSAADDQGFTIADMRLEGLEGPGREDDLPTKPRTAKAAQVVVESLDANDPVDLAEPPVAEAAPPPVVASKSYPATPMPVVAPQVRDRFDPDGEDLVEGDKSSPDIALAVDLNIERRAMGRPLADLDRRARAVADFGKPPFLLLTPLYTLRVARRRAALTRRADQVRAELPILEAEVREAQAAVGRAVFVASKDHRVAAEAGAVGKAVDALRAAADEPDGGRASERKAAARQKLDAELSVEERLASLGQAAVSRVAGASVTAPLEAKARAAALRLEEARAELDLCMHGRDLYDPTAFRSGWVITFLAAATLLTLVLAGVIAP